jgi:DNA-binding FrmR family transcriptional regulator
MGNHTKSKQVIERLSRIEGHIRGIKKMVEEGKECEDVLIQISAVQSAIKSLSIVILKDHMEHCIVEAIDEGRGEEAVENLGNALKHVVK